MDSSGARRIIPIALVLIVIVLAVAALVSVGRTLFFGGSQEATPEITTAQEALTNTNSSRSVRMTLRGPITGSEDFHSYTITISPSSRNMTSYVGYVGQQLDNTQLENNTQAYEQFVYALDRLDLMGAAPLTGDANDLRGICALGHVTVFEVLQDSTIIQSLWTTDCRNITGSLKANSAQASRLFQRQIPNFGQLRQKTGL